MTFLEALKAGKAALALARRADDLLSPQAQFDRSVEQINSDMTQVIYAVGRALVAHALGAEPDSATVEAFLAAAVGEPHFPSRAYRLLGEAKKATSWRRRVLLASVLYGLPFTEIPEEERERVDMVVERMTVADAELLKALADRIGVGKPDEKTHLTSQQLCVARSGLRVALATYEEVAFGVPGPEVFERSAIDPQSFASLRSLGCVELRSSPNPTVHGVLPGPETINSLHVTAVGNLVLGALEEVKAGIEAERPAEPVASSTLG